MNYTIVDVPITLVPACFVLEQLGRDDVFINYDILNDFDAS